MGFRRTHTSKCSAERHDEEVWIGWDVAWLGAWRSRTSCSEARAWHRLDTQADLRPSRADAGLLGRHGAEIGLCVFFLSSSSCRLSFSSFLYLGLPSPPPLLFAFVLLLRAPGGPIPKNRTGVACLVVCRTRTACEAPVPLSGAAEVCRKARWSAMAIRPTRRPAVVDQTLAKLSQHRPKCCGSRPKLGRIGRTSAPGATRHSRSKRSSAISEPPGCPYLAGSSTSRHWQP